jgi:ABC-type Zn uptake system ZnuABC Zn-binding protein ZnuA
MRLEPLKTDHSEEVVEFQSIKLNPHHAILPEALLESIKAVNEDIGILDNREQHYYKERFSELHELLLAMVVKLRNS